MRGAAAAISVSRIAKTRRSSRMLTETDPVQSSATSSGRPTQIRSSSGPAAPCRPQCRLQSTWPFSAWLKREARAVSALPVARNLLFQNLRHRTITRSCSSSQRQCPLLLQIGSSRPQYPKTCRQNLQPLNSVPLMTRSRTPPHRPAAVPGNSPGEAAANHHASSRPHQALARCLATLSATPACTSHHPPMPASAC